MGQLLSQMLLEAKLDDKERCKQMAVERVAGLESQMVSSGHAVVMGRLAAQHHKAGLLNERKGGLSQLEFAKSLVSSIENDWEGVLARLRELRSKIVRREGATFSLTGDTSSLVAAEAPLEHLISGLPYKTGTGFSPTSYTVDVKRNEGLIVPTQVNYVGKAANIYSSGYQHHGSSAVISKFLGTTWLWDRVRVSGGAYGGFCSFNFRSGGFAYASYRDPNLEATLDVYDGTSQFLREVALDDDAVSKAIVGCIGELDSPMLPDAKGYTSFSRHLLGEGPEGRQERRDQVLGTTEAHFREFAEALDAVKMNGSVVVVGSQDAIQAANAAGAQLDVTTVM